MLDTVRNLLNAWENFIFNNLFCLNLGLCGQGFIRVLLDTIISFLIQINLMELLSLIFVILIFGSIYDRVIGIF